MPNSALATSVERPTSIQENTSTIPDAIQQFTALQQHSAVNKIRLYPAFKIRQVRQGRCEEGWLVHRPWAAIGAV